MMSKRFFLLIVLSVFIVFVAAATQQKAVFAGGTAQGPEGSCQHMNIALIFPDNASRAVTSARDYNSKMGADVLNVNAIFADLTAAFARNFKSAVRVEKREDAGALNVDLIAVLDVQYTLPETVDNDVKYEVSATIMTPAQVSVDSIRGSSVKSPASFPGANAAKRIEDAIKVAAIEAEYRIEDALHASAKITAFCSPNQLSGKAIAPASPPQTTAAKSAVIANSSPEKAITAPSPTQAEAVTSETAASSPAKKAHKTPSSKRAAKVKSRKTSSEAGKVASIDTTSGRNAYAIVIGVEQYRQKLPKAEFAAHDAQAMTEALTKVMGYPAENVITLINDQATHADLAKYVEKWLLKNVKSGSTVFIYFSGLGTSNPETGDAFLVPFDGDPSFIDQTGYSLKRMSDAFRKLPVREIIVVLDSCFSGAGGKSVLVEGARPMAVNLQKSLVLSRNMTVLTAASGDQGCSSYQAKGQSLFTYYLINGIKNEDVMLPDGSVDLGDLFSYVQPQVERVALKRNNSAQSPQMIEPK